MFLLTFLSYPASLLMVKFPLGKYLSTVLWVIEILLGCQYALTRL